MKANHALLVLSSTTDDELALIREAKKALNRAPDAKLSFVYVIEDTPPNYYQLPSVNQSFDQQQRVGKTMLKQIGNALGVEPEDRWLQYGNVQHVVQQLTKKLGIDTVLLNTVACVT